MWIARPGNATQVALGLGSGKEAGAPDGSNNFDREAIADFMAHRLGRLFADVSNQVRYILADGDHAVIEHRLSATLPNGRPYVNDYCFVFRAEDGRVAEIREYMDTRGGWAQAFGDGPARADLNRGGWCRRTIMIDCGRTGGGERMMGLGNRVYGAAGIALGVIGLVWGGFNAPWHAVPPELLPPASAAHAPLAYAVAVLFLIGGLAGQMRRTAAGGALVLAALFAMFALLWGYRASQYPGIFGIWLGVAEQSALAIGGAVAAINVLHDDTHPRRAQVGRLAFGVCLLAFGAAHLIYVKETAAMVPAWLPPRQDVWAYATGVAHILAGLAFLSGVATMLASRLLVLMFIGFGALVWVPQLLADPHGHIAWAGNAINLALIGAAWVLAESIARSRSA